MSNCKFLFVFLLCCNISFAQSVQEDVYYTYNSDGLVTQEKKAQSNGDILFTNHVYVKDLNIPNNCNVPTGPTVLGFLNLVNKNIIDNPIETYTVVQKSGGGSFLVSDEFYLYGANTPYPNYYYKLQTAAPIPTGSFTPIHLSVNQGNCEIVINSTSPLEESYNIYDTYGNLLEKTVWGGKNFSYMYSFKGAYKIAEVENASNNQIAYTSFETADMGFWNYNAGGCLAAGTPIAGVKCYKLSYGDVTRNSLPAGNYVVSYWRRGHAVTVTGTNSGGTPGTPTLTVGPSVNGWTYEEYVLQNITDVDISGSTQTVLIDELRLYPQNALMQTYNYNPLVGYDYTCDVADHLTYYQYDDLGRLILIKDQNGNITKKYEYGLQQTE